MTSLRESQHSLLSEDTIDTGRQHSQNSRNNCLTNPDFRYHSASQSTWSEEVLRNVNAGISNSSGDAVPANKRDSIDSTATTSPRDTYEIPQSPKSPQSHQSSYTHVRCPNRAPILQQRLSWGPLTLLVLAFYVTIFSGIYLGIALRKPRWHTISSTGSLDPSTASLLSAFFAKTIELAYVTICVAFLGQVLSRRALARNSRGISISDMNMKAWIMQPGSMIVHWEALQFSALTFLGSIALISTFVAMLYTTAAQALVAPKLSLGPVELRILQGKVTASFANPLYFGSDCETPITTSMDPLFRNIICTQIENAGHAYYNYQQWTTQWNPLVSSNNATLSQLRARPQPPSLGCKNHSKCSIWDNTTITGSWINIQDMATLSKKYGRMINNITMAMPHGGIPAAAMNSKNKIKNPTEASDEGKYTIKASVPSPALNVLCAGISKEELEPLVYASWPGGSKFNSTTWTSSPPDNIPRSPSWLNRTVVDDIFQFGPKHGQVPPIFGKYPMPYNTIINSTGIWPSSAIYLLGATPPYINTYMPQYVMCSLRVKQTGVCSTKYFADTSNAFLSTDCENSSNDLQYDRRQGRFHEGQWEPDWKNIASEWAYSLDLNSGISDGQAVNSRLLMQLMPRYEITEGTFALDPSLPSISEALAVMAGSTLILGSQDAPFLPFWKYGDDSGGILAEPVYEAFNASFQAVGYASGGTKQWEGIFYVVLVLALLTSSLCLVFMIVEARGRQVTDFTEPQNLFALAMNSPQTAQLWGACGCGPSRKQMKERWFIGIEEEDEHYYIRSKTEEKLPLPRKPIDSTHLEPMEIDDGGGKMPSATVDEFRKVSKRHSFLAKLYGGIGKRVNRARE